MTDKTTGVIVIDTETTGVDVSRDQIIEITIQAGTAEDAECWTRRIKPSVAIPPAATAVHGISDADVADCPPFQAFAGEISRRLGEAEVIIGYNMRRFDLPLVLAELERAGERLPDLSAKCLIDVYCLWQNCEPRTLSDAHRRFVGQPLDGAHGAEGDTRGTARVLTGMVKAFGLGADWAGLAEKSATNWLGFSSHFQWQEGVAVFGFGKHRGKALHAVGAQDPGYFEFIIGNDFPSHVVAISRELLRRRDGGLFSVVEFHAWLVASYGGPPVAE